MRRGATFDHVGVIGAGIVGLAVAREVQLQRPGIKVTVWDKEQVVAMHQTGHTNGVVHSGLLYEPGSLKARLCQRGRELLRDYCAQRGVPLLEVGKLVVAASVDERAVLAVILDRARRNGVPDVRWLEGAELTRVEPYAAGAAAVHSPHSAVVDFRAVAAALAADVEAGGGEIRLGQKVTGVEERSDGVTVTSNDGVERADRLVVCAGLGTDRVAAAAGRRADIRIVAFRAEYRRLVGPARDRVKGLIYPVPDPRNPFLGIHLGRTADGEVLIGPNAVPALSPEGYRRSDIDAASLARLLWWPGGRQLAKTHWRAGVKELRSSLWKPTFAAAARRYVPSLRSSDLGPGPSGVRAQAVDRHGRIIDDFVLDISGRIAIVRNAPSPAATSGLAIAEYLVSRLLRE